MKRYDTKGYLIGTLGAFVFSAIFLVQAWPIFIKLFIPFPQIEETTVYEGTLHIEGSGHRTKFGQSAPDYYIVDKQGIKHKIFWGFPGREEDRFLSKNVFDKSVGKVYFHPTFGVVEEHFDTFFPYKGHEKWSHSYDDRKFNFEHQFEYRKYLWPIWISLIALVFGLYYLGQFKSLKLRKEEDKNDNN
jgi:hypothetical protein